MVTIRLLCMSRKSASMRSFNSGARICRKLTCPIFLPMVKVLPFWKEKELGAMKSLVDRPVAGSQLQSNLKEVCSSMWKMPCINSRRWLPFSASACTPSRLKLLRTSVSMRSKRGLALFRASASMPKVRYLVLMRPLLPFASWSFSICVYSRRILSCSSSFSGMAMRSE